MKIDATHSIWPWIAEHAGFLLTRFEVGRDGKTAYERLKGTSAEVQGMAFAEVIFWKRKRAGGLLGQLTCMWEDGVYFGVKVTTAEVIVRNRNGVWLRGTVRRKPAKERWDRRNLEMVVAAPWRKNEDDPKMDGERPKSEVVTKDQEKKSWRQKSTCHVRIWRNLDSQRGVRPVCMSLLREISAHEKLSKANRGGAEGHSEGTCGDKTHERVPRQSG